MDNTIDRTQIIKNFIDDYGLDAILDQCKTSQILYSLDDDDILNHLDKDDVLDHFDIDEYPNYMNVDLETAMESIEYIDSPSIQFVKTPTLNSLMELEEFLEIFYKKYGI